MVSKTVRQRPEIFRRTDKDAPAPEDSETSSRQDGETLILQDVQQALQQGGKADKPQKLKVTFHLLPEDILAIDAIISEEFRRSGERWQRSEVVGRALQALLKQRDG